MVQVEFKKLYEDSILPKKAHESDAGFDLFAHSGWIWLRDTGLRKVSLNDDGEWVISPHNQMLFKTGIGMAIPPGYEAQVRPRSGLALKHGISITNSPGTIDAGYRDEVGVILVSIGMQGGFGVKPGDRIAQLVIQKLPEVEVVEVSELTNPSDRGAAGFGSTGV